MAGVFASMFTHPMDVVRARLTVQDQSSKAYSGMYFTCVPYAPSCKAHTSMHVQCMGIAANFTSVINRSSN